MNTQIFSRLIMLTKIWMKLQKKDYKQEAQRLYGANEKQTKAYCSCRQMNKDKLQQKGQ